jgi:hypothetical protein
VQHAPSCSRGGEDLGELVEVSVVQGMSPFRCRPHAGPGCTVAAGMRVCQP